MPRPARSRAGARQGGGSARARRASHRHRRGPPAPARRTARRRRARPSAAGRTRHSPAIRSGSRLVATIRRAGAAASSSASGRAASGSSCSRLSRTTWVRFSPIRVAIAAALAPEAPRRSAISGHDQCGSRTGASGTKTVPPSASSARNRASSIENRVLPVPPGPTIVSTRGSRSSQREAASKSSRSRPRNCVAGVGQVDGARRPQRGERPRCRAGTAGPERRSP